MKKVSLALVALFSLFMLPAAAHATTGYSTANVNMRSGPSTWYPAVAVVPAGSPVAIYGCIDDLTWCDIGWGPMRGWINSFYLTVPYQSRRVVIAHSPWIRVPVLSFHFDNYWDRHYRSRPFYRERSHWHRRHNDYWDSRRSGPSRRDYQPTPAPRLSPQQPAPREQVEAQRPRGGWGSSGGRQDNYQGRNRQDGGEGEQRRRRNRD